MAESRLTKLEVNILKDRLMTQENSSQTVNGEFAFKIVHVNKISVVKSVISSSASLLRATYGIPKYRSPKGRFSDNTLLRRLVERKNNWPMKRFAENIIYRRLVVRMNPSPM